MLKRLLSKLKNQVVNQKQLGQVNYEVKDHGGNLIPDTRISNSTIIESPKKLVLGSNVFIGHFNFIEASNGISIEEGCQITNYISILSHSSHNSIRYYGKHYRSVKDPIGYQKGEVKIGAYTFVGPHVTIMPNTTIGKGAIIASHSLVKGEFPDFAIIAGNPAKVVGNTKDKDLTFLKDHPELEQYYNEWVNQ